MTDPNPIDLLNKNYVSGCRGCLGDTSPESMKGVERADNANAAFLHKSAGVVKLAVVGTTIIAEYNSANKKNDPDTDSDPDTEVIANRGRGRYRNRYRN